MSWPNLNELSLATDNLATSKMADEPTPSHPLQVSDGSYREFSKDAKGRHQCHSSLPSLYRPATPNSLVDERSVAPILVVTPTVDTPTVDTTSASPVERQTTEELPPALRFVTKYCVDSVQPVLNLENKKRKRDAALEQLEK